MHHGLERSFMLEAVREGIPDDGDAVAFVQGKDWLLRRRTERRDKRKGQGKEWTDHGREAIIYGASVPILQGFARPRRGAAAVALVSGMACGTGRPGHFLLIA
jgi:hypothetical protein